MKKSNIFNHWNFENRERIKKAKAKAIKDEQDRVKAEAEAARKKEEDEKKAKEEAARKEKEEAKRNKDRVKKQTKKARQKLENFCKVLFFINSWVSWSFDFYQKFKFKLLCKSGIKCKIHLHVC